ncbi:hypothetical protein [Aquirhabdus parva]|uniref:Scaffold protein FimL second domain-containing protein n=1 Tax=Aquirhabdus parva TaxID=2283318 RepID=A0A345P620_9GAMM|nr:hypothetical protein [Aquirhabdus parva]AXI02729.1 hypothetical protein HYN46_07705 [Aquirhabdus parva]
MPASLVSNPKSYFDVQHFDISSLYIVKSEINASLNQVESALSLFISDQSVTVGLFDAADAMHQVTGILKLLRMDGAIELSDGIRLLLINISENPDTTDDSKITALSEGLMTLTRYLEFVLLNETLSAQLLLPITNLIRNLLGLPFLSEGYYLQPYLDEDAIQKNASAATTSPLALQENQKQVIKDQLVQMFQTGLRAVLQKKSQARDFALMHKATTLMTSLSVQPEALYWQVAAQVIATLKPSSLLTDSRKRVLIHIERRITQQNTPLTRDSIADLLAMTAIMDDANPLLAKFGLTDLVKPDQETLNHKQFLFGPDQEMIHTVSQLVHQDIAKIKELVDLIVNNQQPDDALNTLSNSLKELGQTLEVLTLNYAGKGLVDQANRVKEWVSLPDENQINALMDHLLDSENAIILMEQTHTPGLVMLPFTNLRISLHQLVDARSLIVAESRTSLAGAMDVILSYLDNNADATQIQSIAEACESVSGAMAFLNAPRGQAILRAAAQYVHESFEITQPSLQSIEYLTDAIACVDYVLEGMEKKKPAGENPYHFGERSLAKLGYPVDQIAA